MGFVSSFRLSPVRCAASRRAFAEATVRGHLFEFPAYPSKFVLLKWGLPICRSRRLSEKLRGKSSRTQLLQGLRMVSLSRDATLGRTCK